MKDALEEAPGLCGCKECVSDDEPSLAGVEYVTSSVKRRGNRNKATILREQREKLKQKRTNAFKRCDRVSSREA